MSLEDHVLPGDLTDAAKEQDCLTQCLFLAWRAAKHGHYKAADELVKDAGKSRLRLDELFRYKKDHDAVREFLTPEMIQVYEKQMYRRLHSGQ